MKPRRQISIPFLPAAQPNNFFIHKGDLLMNSKSVILGLIVLAMFAFSANAQRIGPLTPQQVILQDDKTGDHLLFVLSSGEYKFQSCEGNIAISGVGKVSVSGCKVTLRDITETRRVLVEVDLCARAGKANVALMSASLGTRDDLPVLDFVISDLKTSDSVFDCLPKPIELK
jgi:hypothetical protein